MSVTSGNYNNIAKNLSTTPKVTLLKSCLIKKPTPRVSEAHLMSTDETFCEERDLLIDKDGRKERRTDGSAYN